MSAQLSRWLFELSSAPVIVGQKGLSDFLEFGWRSLERGQDSCSFVTGEGDDLGAEHQGLFELASQRSLQDRCKLTDQPIFERDATEQHAAVPPESAVTGWSPITTTRKPVPGVSAEQRWSGCRQDAGGPEACKDHQ